MPERLLPYGRQTVDADDIGTVVETLKSDFLTTGPEIAAFEADLSAMTGAAHVAVLNSCTSALHATYAAVGVGPGDEIVTSPMTFAATSNAALFLGARPVFVDIDPSTGLIDPDLVEGAISNRTRAVVAIDYAGQPADYEALCRIAERHNVPVVADAAQSLGATDRGRAVGTLADATVVSFHPVKLITTGEGGAVLTDDAELRARVAAFRSHGMVREPSQLNRDEGPWYMEMQSLGLNYRLTDFQCALGRSQLRKVPAFLSPVAALSQRRTTEISPRSPNWNCPGAVRGLSPRGIYTSSASRTRRGAGGSLKSSSVAGSGFRCTTCRSTAIPTIRTWGTRRVCAR